ncbi:MAG: methyltransferase domain-containing protein [Endomicrobia bacterium]|nr:methyltransferase domain-containing protein [Endomicrobiia bacterium]
MGCGVGKLVVSLFREGYEVYGVDVSDVNIENLESKFTNSKSAVRFIYGSLFITVAEKVK